MHRKSQQIASCLRPPLSQFHCVITSFSWKCGHSSTLFTYSVYQTGSLSSWLLLTPCVTAAGHFARPSRRCADETRRCENVSLHIIKKVVFYLVSTVGGYTSKPSCLRSQSGSQNINMLNKNIQLHIHHLYLNRSSGGLPGVCWGLSQFT